MSVYAGSFTANLVISSWLLWLICSSFGHYQLVIPTPGKCSAMVCVPWGQAWSWWYGYRSWPEALPNGTFPESAAVENDTEPQHILFLHLQICLGDPYLFPPHIYLHLSELLQSKSIYWKLIYFNILEKGTAGQIGMLLEGESLFLAGIVKVFEKLWEMGLNWLMVGSSMQKVLKAEQGVTNL